MKKNKNILNFALPIIISATLIPTSVLSLSQSNNDVIEIKKNSEINFISPDVNNNRIIDSYGGDSYKFKNIVSAADIQDPNKFNGSNVISESTMLTVRNEDLFFNFINNKTPSVANQKVRIMATQTNPNSTVLPFSIETSFSEIIGSAHWANNQLIVVGLSSGNVEIHSYKIENNTFLPPTINNDIFLNSIFDINAPNLQINGLIKSGINTLPSAIWKPTAFQPYEVRPNPIALSPIVNFDNPNNSTEFIVWPLYQTVDKINETGVGKLGWDDKGQLTIERIPTLVDTTETGNPFVAGATLLALTPAIQDGQLDLFGHLNLVFNKAPPTDPPTDNWVPSTSSVYAISNLKPQGKIELEIITEGSIERYTDGNPFAVQPYGLIAKGGEENPDLNNIYWMLTQDVDRGIIPKIFSTVHKPIENSGGKFDIPIVGETVFDLVEMLSTHTPSETFSVDQYSYPNSGDLENGFHIALRGRGVTNNNGYALTKIGYWKWNQPWNKNEWGGNSTIAAKNSSFTNSIPLNNQTIVNDAMGTVWNNLYSEVGTRTNFELAELKGDSKIRIFDLDQKENIWNTVIPTYITLSKSPNNLSISEIGSIILNKSKDIPKELFNFPNLKVTNLENGDISVEGIIPNQYHNGRKMIGSQLEFLVNIIKYSPSENLTINLANPFNLPSSAFEKINSSVTNKGIIEIPGFIGSKNNDLIQLNASLLPLVNSMEMTYSDFLGTLDIKISIIDSSGKSMIIEEKIIGFIGYVYIIPIVVGFVTIFSLLLWLLIFLLNKRNKRRLQTSLSEGFNTSSINLPSTSKTVTVPSMGLRPTMGQPGRPTMGQPGRPAMQQPGRPAMQQPGRPTMGQPGRPPMRPR